MSEGNLIFLTEGFQPFNKLVLQKYMPLLDTTGASVCVSPPHFRELEVPVIKKKIATDVFGPFPILPYADKRFRSIKNRKSVEYAIREMFVFKLPDQIDWYEVVIVLYPVYHDQLRLIKSLNFTFRYGFESGEISDFYFPDLFHDTDPEILMRQRSENLPHKQIKLPEETIFLLSDETGVIFHDVNIAGGFYWCMSKNPPDSQKEKTCMFILQKDKIKIGEDNFNNKIPYFELERILHKTNISTNELTKRNIDANAPYIEHYPELNKMISDINNERKWYGLPLTVNRDRMDGELIVVEVIFAISYFKKHYKGHFPGLEYDAADVVVCFKKKYNEEILSGIIYITFAKGGTHYLIREDFYDEGVNWIRNEWLVDYYDNNLTVVIESNKNKNKHKNKPKNKNKNKSKSKSKSKNIFLDLSKKVLEKNRVYREIKGMAIYGIHEVEEAVYFRSTSYVHELTLKNTSFGWKQLSADEVSRKCMKFLLDV